MNEAAQHYESTQSTSLEQGQTELAIDIAYKVRTLAERREELAKSIDSGGASPEKLEELDDLDHVLLGARADLIQQTGTAGAKPQDE